MGTSPWKQALDSCRDAANGDWRPTRTDVNMALPLFDAHLDDYLRRPHLTPASSAAYRKVLRAYRCWVDRHLDTLPPTEGFGSLQTSPRATLTTLAGLWIAEAETNGRVPRTLRHYAKTIQSYLEWLARSGQEGKRVREVRDDCEGSYTNLKRRLLAGEVVGTGEAPLRALSSLVAKLRKQGFSIETLPGGMYQRTAAR